MRKAWFALFFLLFFVSGWAATTPYTISSVDASNIETNQKPTVSLVCFDRDGINMNTDATRQQVTLEFFNHNGTSLGTSTADCSTDPSAPFNNAPDVFKSPGLYYVKATLDCSPACCQASGGCSNTDWFSVTAPFTPANVPDNGIAGALVACTLVFFAVRKK